MNACTFTCLCSAAFLHSHTVQDHPPPHLGNGAAHSVQGLPTSTHFIKAFPYRPTQCRLPSQVTFSCVKVKVKATHHTILVLGMLSGLLVVSQPLPVRMTLMEHKGGHSRNS